MPARMAACTFSRASRMESVWAARPKEYTSSESRVPNLFVISSEGKNPASAPFEEELRCGSPEKDEGRKNTIVLINGTGYLLRTAVVRSFTRDGYIVRMAFQHTGIGDAGELGIVQLLNVGSAAVAHAGT